MSMPKTLASWCMVLFFLVFGLGYVLPSFMAMGFFNLVVGLLALGAAVFTFIGK